MNSEAESMWNRFIEYLNQVEPLGKRGEMIPHQSMLGSIEHYKKLFLEANKCATTPK